MKVSKLCQSVLLVVKASAAKIIVDGTRVRCLNPDVRYMLELITMSFFGQYVKLTGLSS